VDRAQPQDGEEGSVGGNDADADGTADDDGRRGTRFLNCASEGRRDSLIVFGKHGGTGPLCSAFLLGREPNGW
jgi:hypothetical protein